MKTMEEILEGSIKNAQAIVQQSLDETNRISDRMFKLLGDPYATVADLHKEDPAPDPADPKPTDAVA